MAKTQKFTAFTLVASLIVAIGGLLFGYNTSSISGAILFLAKDFNLSTIAQEMIVSIILIGALIGACFGGILTDRVGRKATLILTTVVFLIGTFLVMTANHIAMLVIGRIILGLAIGIVSLSVPLYIAEMSDPRHRGALVSLNQLAITIGILLAYVVDYFYAPTGDWRSMFGIALIPTILLFIGLFFIPETPSFLASQGKKEKALKILKKIEIDTSKSEVALSTKISTKKMASWKKLFEKSVRPALFAGIGISVFQQITGINIVIYYAPRIFQLAGLESAASAILATMGVGTINLFMTFVALWLIDMVGRKPLLIVGILGMVASLGVLGIGFLESTKATSIISIVSLMTYVSFFAISLGPVAWLIISEIYPMGIRGRAMGIAIFANWTCNYIVSLTFLTLVDFLGKSGTFWLYAAIGLLALWFVIKKIPETKGKELKEIQDYFKKKAAKK
ncbi:MAG: putative metabolite transport protein CsbC [Candidatus Anoxychlamydiales bacterium]|nr:putative metabolite transport protein CsbC [Candidatus Anoxychlamydiales bacterium]